MDEVEAPFLNCPECGHPACRAVRAVEDDETLKLSIHTEGCQCGDCGWNWAEDGSRFACPGCGVMLSVIIDTDGYAALTKHEKAIDKYEGLAITRYRNGTLRKYYSHGWWRQWMGQPSAAVFLNESAPPSARWEWEALEGAKGTAPTYAVACKAAEASLADTEKRIMLAAVLAVADNAVIDKRASRAETENNTALTIIRARTDGGLIDKIDTLRAERDRFRDLAEYMKKTLLAFGQEVEEEGCTCDQSVTWFDRKDLCRACAARPVLATLLGPRGKAR